MTRRSSLPNLESASTQRNLHHYHYNIPSAAFSTTTLTSYHNIPTSRHAPPANTYRRINKINPPPPPKVYLFLAKLQRFDGQKHKSKAPKKAIYELYDLFNEITSDHPEESTTTNVLNQYLTWQDLLLYLQTIQSIGGRESQQMILKSWATITTMLPEFYGYECSRVVVNTVMRSGTIKTVDEAIEGLRQVFKMRNGERVWSRVLWDSVDVLARELADPVLAWEVCKEGVKVKVELVKDEIESGKGKMWFGSHNEVERKENEEGEVVEGDELELETGRDEGVVYKNGKAIDAKAAIRYAETIPAMIGYFIAKPCLTWPLHDSKEKNESIAAREKVRSTMLEVIDKMHTDGHQIDSVMFDALARVTRETRQLFEILALAEKYNVSLSHYSYNHMIRVCMRNGDVGATDAFWRRLKSSHVDPSDTLIYHMIIESGRFKNAGIEFAFRVFDWMKEEYPDLDADGKLTEAVIFAVGAMDVQSNYRSRLLGMIEESRDRYESWTPDTLARMVYFFASLNRMDEAESFFNMLKGRMGKVKVEKMHSPSSSSETWTPTTMSSSSSSVASSQSQSDSNSSDDNLEIRHDLIRSSYNLLLRSFAKVHSVKKCLAIYKDMLASGYHPDYRTYTIMVDNLAFYHPIDASRFLTDMETFGVKRDVVIYTALIYRHVQAGRLDLAIQTLKSMRLANVRPNTMTFNSLISGLCKVGQFDRVEKLISRMKELQCQPDAVTFGTLLDGYLSRGRWDDADLVLKRMNDAGVEMDDAVFGILIKAQIRRDDEMGDDGLNRAKELLEKMQRAPYNLVPSIRTYSHFLVEHYLRGEWDLAEVLFEKLRGSRYLRQRPVASTYERAVEYMAKAGELDRADAMVVRMKTELNVSFVGEKATVALIRGAGKLGDIRRARNYFDDFVTVTGGRRGERVAGDGVNAAMISAFIAVGDFESGINWANSIVPGAGIGNATLQGIRKWSMQFTPVVTGGGNKGGKVGRGNDEEEDDGRSVATDSWTGTVAIGRATSYALMILHAKAGKLDWMEAVHAQMKRIEAWGFGNVREVPGKKYTINEGNLLIQCYGMLFRPSKSLEVWKSMWIDQTLSAETNSPSRPPSLQRVTMLNEITDENDDSEDPSDSLVDNSSTEDSTTTAPATISRDR
ncbi:hypothetical protein HDU76_012750, partial [Blyttiomyces sp. JEL0837]